jgi:nitrite reductase/ring-hydroxylating ferredoxin subunit
MISISDLKQQAEGDWIDFGPEDMVERGKSCAVQANGRSLLLCHTSAGVFTVENLCSHQKKPLDRARIMGEHIMCPHHGARFELRTGCPVSGLATLPLRTFPTKLQAGRVLVQISTK